MARHARLCLIGPECVGKSVLAARLARELGTVWVPEFAREYALRAGCVLTADDVEPIAGGQIAGEERLAPSANGLLILDTDLVSTVVYARHYYGSCPTWIERAAAERRADLYLLLDTDVPWMEDPARDAGDEGTREDLFDAFRRALDEFECAFRIVSGGWEERWAATEAAARELYGRT
jgi:NadR type nicotinamide-nucleotide adenylyltransferase